MAIELSITIPFYDEEKNVENVISELVEVLKKDKINYEILSVNNGSLDGTGRILTYLSKKNPRIKVVTVKKNKGYGFGVLSGLNKSNGDYIGYTWGDGQLPANSVVKVFQNLKNNDLDICKTIRVTRDDGTFRRIQSFFYNNLIRILFSLDIKDINGCPKIMKKEVYKNLNLKSKDWFLDAELILKAHKNKYKIRNVEINFKKRKEGESKVKLIYILEFLKNIIKFRIKGDI